MNNIILELKNISKEYYQGESVMKVLNNFNLTLHKGESIGIIGASGSGKSTLLSIIGLLDKEYSGNIIINNINISSANETIRNKIKNQVIGFVFQKYMLIPNISARDNVSLPSIIKGEKSNIAFNKADKLLEELGLKNKIFNMPGELSGGEQQRVAIARSLINNPNIIIADEPTGNLDNHNGELILEILIQYTKNNNTSLLMVSHNEDFIKKLDKTIKL